MIRKLAKEQRKKKRGSISVPVTFTGVEEGKTVAGEGTTADASKEGIGFFSDKEVDPGTILEIECNDMWSAPRQFTVKWCDRIQYNFYRLGLELRART